MNKKPALVELESVAGEDRQKVASGEEIVDAVAKRFERVWRCCEAS